MIIVTGGSSGIGKSITEELISKGEKVITISRSGSENNPNHFACDICDYESLKKVYKKLNNGEDSLKAIINCAGIASMNLALTTPPEVAEKVIKTNLLGTIYCCQIFSPLLIRNKGGRIINFSTIAVSIGLKGESIYVASKAGLIGLTKQLAFEVAKIV